MKGRVVQLPMWLAAVVVATILSVSALLGWQIGALIGDQQQLLIKIDGERAVIFEQMNEALDKLDQLLDVHRVGEETR